MKKIPLIAIIIGIILVIGGLIFVWKFSLPGNTQPKISQESFRDSDNDGLRDWEEELYKTDPNNPDTDGDGYLDGEEVDSGNNPLIKAPGDKLTFYPLPLGKKYNITEKVFDDQTMDSILGSYILQKAEYINDHPEVDSPETFSASIKQSTLEEMARRAFGDSYSILFEKAGETLENIPEVFNIQITDQDIKISDDNSQEAIKLYLSQVSSILNADVFFLQEQSFKALSSAFQDGNFSKLDELIKSNDSKIEQAKEIIVPSSWKEIHKKGLELTLLIRNIFVSLRDFQNDPLKSYIAVNELEKFSGKWNDLMKEAINLAKQQGIELNF